MPQVTFFLQTAVGAQHGFFKVSCRHIGRQKPMCTMCHELYINKTALIHSLLQWLSSYKLMLVGAKFSIYTSYDVVRNPDLKFQGLPLVDSAGQSNEDQTLQTFI